MAGKGNEKTGGRQKGVQNKVNSKITEIIEASGKKGPARILLDEMNNIETEPAVRRKIAEILLPYTERRQPTSIENDNTNHYPTGIDITFTKPETPDEP